GVLDAERCILALEPSLALEYAADVGVELEQAELQCDDPDQRERDQADPRAAADQPVDQRVVGGALVQAPQSGKETVRRGARGVTSAPSGSPRQTQTGSAGGQTQPWARAARKRFTRRSSSEWNEIAASAPSTRSRDQASGSARSSWPSSSFTAIRRAWKER